jgi:hypothetical protein
MHVFGRNSAKKTTLDRSYTQLSRAHERIQVDISDCHQILFASESAIGLKKKQISKKCREEIAL